MAQKVVPIQIETLPSVGAAQPDLVEKSEGDLPLKTRLINSTAPFRKWRWLQGELRRLLQTSQQVLEQIEVALVDYRLTMTGLRYKANRVDERVWTLYRQIQEEHTDLRRQTFQVPLIFRSRKKLSAMLQTWRELEDLQKEMINLLNDAPKALEFYNKMQLQREKRREQRRKIAENTRKIAAARASLEKSLQYVDEQVQETELITLDSKILHLDGVRKTWDDKVNEVYQLEKLGVENAEEILKSIHLLENAIRDTPATVKWIRSIDERLRELLYMHDLLVSYGKGCIPQSEIARVTVMFFDKVPGFWASGDQRELERTLKTLENFINYYHQQASTTLAIEERRNPGFTRSIAASRDGNKIDLPQFTQMARSLVNAIDARDHFMRGHSVKVTELALKMARKMNWSTADLEFLEIAALLHDVGKLSIPEAVLNKTDRLSVDETKLIQQHPMYGAQIIKPIQGINKIIPWIYHHQERWDGKGYPDRLSGQGIPMASSIISVAEAYSVMTIDMPWRRAISQKEALEIMKKEAGEQFHPEVIDVFGESVEDAAG